MPRLTMVFGYRRLVRGRQANGDTEHDVGCQQDSMKILNSPGITRCLRALPHSMCLALWQHSFGIPILSPFCLYDLMCSEDENCISWLMEGQIPNAYLIGSNWLLQEKRMQSGHYRRTFQEQ